MNPNPKRKEQNYLGYVAYFEGQRLGTVTDDRVQMSGGRMTSRRIATLDNGMALLDPDSETAAAEGFILRSPAEEEEARNGRANAFCASPVVGEKERGDAYAERLCLGACRTC
jgi:hypothetical protein